MIPLRRFFLSTLLLAASVVVVLGQDSRYDILHGSGGESACTLQKNIVASGKCTTSTRRDFSFPSILNREDDTSPVPSKCTCNHVFFNIWSACCYSSGNNTLPNFTQWTQTCGTSSINVESNTGFSELPGSLGIDVPSWATLSVPGNTTFDLQKAVMIASSTVASSTVASSKSHSKRWTTLQIILPVVVAVGTLLISGVVLLIYQRYWRKFSQHSSHMGRPKCWKRLHLQTSHRVVSTTDRDESWEIDGPVAKQPFESFHGQTIPRRESYLDPGTDAHELDKIPKTISSSNSATELIGAHSFRKPTHSAVRLPWKRRPPHIKLVPATSRFRVDEAKSIFTSSGEAVGRVEFDAAEELAESSLDEETTSLITASERATRDSQDVILISRGGRDFTLESRSENTASVSVNSYIKVISPSISSESPHSVRHSVPARSSLYIPIPPPPPSHAAPAPPVMPRGLRPTERPSTCNGQSQAYFQPPSCLSPITESSPTQSYSSSNVSLQQSFNIRRSSNPESIPLQNFNPSTNYFNPHRTSLYSDHSLALESEDDDLYMEYAATNGHDHRPPPADSDASSLSFYYNSPVQEPVVSTHPVRIRSQFSTDNVDPSAFFPGAVRGVYSNQTYTQ